MLKVQVIGCGAAGNKATIDMVESELINSDEMSYLLLNTTDKDIKPEYRNHALIYGNGIGGCGKERNLGKKAIIEDVENGVRSLDKLIDNEADFVIVVGSTEGGTGSAAIPIVSKYIKKVIGKPVIAVLFFGFGDDARGMQNSIEICQELSDEIGIISICNSKFTDGGNINKLDAERYANYKFIEYVRILIGKDIHESDQNIDSTDLKKVVMTPGYMSIQNVILRDVKNSDQYEAMVNEFLDNNDVSMDSPTKSAKRIAVVFSAKPEATYIDYSCNVFKNRYGIPYELFVHAQNCNDLAPTAAVIVSGQKMPIDSINNIFNDYKSLSVSVDKTEDSFFDSVKEFAGNPDDGIFNMFDNVSSKPTVSSSKAAFFEEYGIDATPVVTKPVEKKPGTVKTVGEY